jgi:hypothetical protein
LSAAMRQFEKALDDASHADQMRGCVSPGAGFSVASACATAASPTRELGRALPQQLRRPPANSGEHFRNTCVTDPRLGRPHTLARVAPGGSGGLPALASVSRMDCGPRAPLAEPQFLRSGT